jgi:hypothetical protein
MKANIIKITWGVILILLGGLAIAEQLGYLNVEQYTQQVCTGVFTIISAAFFLTYFLKGIRSWGWLFPALIFAALALTIGTILEQPDNPNIAFPFLLSLAIPNFAGYILNRKQWGFLIPAWVMTVIATIILLEERVDSDWLGAFFLYSIASLFLVGFLSDRRRKWALIAAVVLGFIGTFPLVELLIPGDIKGPVVMLLFTLFFLVIYFTSKKNWWALIPSGVFATIGLVALLDYLFPNAAYIDIAGLEFGAYTSVLFLGLAATFGILWHIRSLHPTDWAKYPALGLLATSIGAFLLGKSFNETLPAVVLLVSGVVMLLTVFIKRRVTRQPTS